MRLRPLYEWNGNRDGIKKGRRSLDPASPSRAGEEAKRQEPRAGGLYRRPFHGTGGSPQTRDAVSVKHGVD